MDQRFSLRLVSLRNPIKDMLLVACASMLWSCESPKTTEEAPKATTTVATVATPPPPAPIIALPYDEAVKAAAKDVLSKAQLPPDRKYTVVIDPLVDGATGIQTAQTDAMEKQLGQIIKTDFPQYEVKPFSSANVAALPLVLIGTFTPINLQGKPEAEKDAYRICYALVDLKSGLIVSKGLNRSKTLGIDSTPKQFFRDSPLWVSDKNVEGYIKTCQGTKAGDPINPAYLDKILAATTIDEAMRAYNAKHYREALALYNAALRTNGGDQPRVRIGMYLANVGLGQRQAAMKAFGEVVDYGLANKRLAVKFEFNPGSASFARSTPLADQWVREIAKQAALQPSCVEVSGHSSRGGLEQMNEQLSLQRAEYVKQRLMAQNKDLADRLKSQGYGSHQTLIGTGKNDLSDSLDRRIEFKPIACTA